MKNSGKLLLLAAIPACIMAACSNHPDGVVSEGKMVDVMSDLTLAEAYSSRPYVVMVDDSTKRLIRQTIMDKNGITEADFDSTLAWYGHNMDQYAILYSKIQKELKERKEKMIGKEIATPEGESLWPLPSMLAVGPNDFSPNISFEIPGSSIKPGEVLEWKMRFNRLVGSGTILLAAEYSELETVVSRRGFRENATTTLHLTTDSTRTPKRIIGYIHFANTPPQMAWIDSISLVSYTQEQMQLMNQAGEYQRSISITK
jgi:hypothetical protein